MPCYCDIPDSTDQAEIERRCKINMYFDGVQELKNIKSPDERKRVLELCVELDLKQFPMDDVNAHLCRLCKVLTKEQMENISAYYFQIEWKHKTLYDWHLQHCKDDDKLNAS